MNLINSSSIAKSDDQLPLKGKARAAQYYLYLVSLYIVLVFNEFISKPVDFYALALIIIGLPLISLDNARLLHLSLKESWATKVAFWSCFLISTLFLMASIKEYQFSSLVAYVSQYGVHIGIALISLLIIPITISTGIFLLRCFLVALVALLITDISLYIYEFLNDIKIGAEFSHRWFGDGYIFLSPFVFTNLVYPIDEFDRNSFFSRFFTFLSSELGSLFLIIVVVILAGGTGSRSTYICLIIEIIFYITLKARMANIDLSKIIIYNLSAMIIFLVLISIISPFLLIFAINRGMNISDRLAGAWTPILGIIDSKLWIGHGFGVETWKLALMHFEGAHQITMHVGGAHNWFLWAGYLGGVFALTAQILLSCSLCFFLINLFFFQGKSSLAKIENRNFVKNCAISVLIIFIGFYLIRGLVESVTYKYSAITLLIVFMINAVSLKNKYSKIEFKKAYN